MCAKLPVHYRAMRAGFGLQDLWGSYNLQVYFFCQADQCLLEIPGFKVWQELPFHIASKESAYMPCN